MATGPKPFRPAALAAAALCGAAALTVAPGDARADDISPNGKGMVGGGLLGAEVVTMVEGVAGVRAGWAYWVGALVGAGGGVAGGYAVEKSVSDGTIPMAMLAGGLALVIPALVVSLDATRFRPEEGATEDHPPVGAPAEPGAAGGSVVGAPPAPPPSSAAPPPQSLLDVHTGDVRVGVPVPNVRPVYSLAEQRQYGLRAETEVRMPVLHVTF